MISIISVTEKGDEIAYKLKENFNSDIYVLRNIKL